MSDIHSLLNSKVADRLLRNFMLKLKTLASKNVPRSLKLAKKKKMKRNENQLKIILCLNKYLRFSSLNLHIWRWDVVLGNWQNNYEFFFKVNLLVLGLPKFWLLKYNHFFKIIIFVSNLFILWALSYLDQRSKKCSKLVLTISSYTYKIVCQTFICLVSRWPSFP